MAVPNVHDDIVENFRTNCVGFAAFTILVWDHIDTLATEVRAQSAPTLSNDRLSLCLRRDL
ncbi:hypothetical protein DFH08DRAFT_966861 [Mycena albidolilacea]|uniref:Uncharacterized protein n=1 Tax=Mycena albidolilacea TaxID=1033008 RepID=A0AAD6ZMU1_9AGAR|nr:hypothetical protein DFH08DRAFT_966861 [Mycena albidolilacea]